MLIIGLGNPDRGDDGAGILVARRLSERGLQAVEHTGAPLDLLDMWAGKEQVAIIDAIVSAAPLGSIHVWDPLAVKLDKSFFQCSTHEFGLADTIELARVLDQLPPWLRIYGVEAAQFEAGADMSEDVIIATVKVAEQLEKFALEN